MEFPCGEVMLMLMDHNWYDVNVTGGDCLHPTASTIANLQQPTAIIV